MLENQLRPRGGEIIISRSITAVVIHVDDRACAKIILSDQLQEEFVAQSVR